MTKKTSNKPTKKGKKMIPLCLNCLSVLNVYGGCDKCNRLLLKEIEENYGES